MIAALFLLDGGGFMANIIANLAVKIGVDTSEFQSKMDSLKNSLQKTGDRLKSVGTTMSASLTAPIVGLGTAVVMTGANFEEAMSKVQAVTGASGKELEQLEAKARELGATTKFSATEAAEAMGYLGMAGFDTNQIMDSMADVLNLAAAGALDLGRAADISSNIMSAFGIEAAEMGRVADVMASAAANANTDIEQLGTAMSYVGPIAGSMGVSLEESTAAIMKMSDAGIQGEKAGTALRGIIASLAQPTGQTAEKLQELGLSAEDVNPKTKSLAEILETLEKAGMSSADAMELVGVEAGPGLAVLLEQGSSALKGQTTALQEADGAAAQMAETMSDNTKGSFKELMSMLQELSLQFYDALKPALAVVIDWLKQLTTWFQQLSPQMKTAIVVIGAIVAAIGPLLIVAGLVVNAISALIPVFGALMGPIGLVIIAIIALVAVGIYLWKNWDKIKAKMAQIWEAIKARAKAIWEGIKASLKSVWEGIKSIVSSAVTWYVNRVKQNWELIKSITKKIWDGIKSFFKNVWDSIKNIVSKGISKARDTIKGYAGRFLDAGKALLESLKKGISQGIEKAIDAVKRGMERIRSFLPFSPAKEGPLRDLDKSGRAFMDTFARGIQAGIPDVRRVVLDVAASTNPGSVASSAPTVGQRQTTVPVEIKVMLDGRQIMPTVRRELTLDLDATFRGVR